MRNIYGGNSRRKLPSNPQQKSEDHLPLPTEDDLLFFPIGGSGEIGMNVNLYGHNKQWIMVDLGITFGDADAYGIQFVTANLDIIKRTNIGRNLKAVIITHAHEDHIGGVHEIWPYFKFHIYVTKFAKQVLLKKLEDKPYFNEVKDFYIHEVPYHGKIKVGHFDIQYLDITHSIPESNALVIKTPVGNILHTGDWKLDPGPVLGQPTNAKKYQQLAKENVMAMVCDSTNAMSKGRSGSEEDVAETLGKLFEKYKKQRIIVTCFASNVARLKTIADLGMKYGRKPCLLGRSILRMIDSADKCQFPIHVERFISEEQESKLKPHQSLIICTGSQGDENAALARMARGVHKLKFKEGDVVLFSSKTIPGNERRINVVQNNLTRLGVEIVTDKDANIHVSGHPCRDELKEMYSWVKPQCVVPVHGEIRHLHEHAKFARQCGYEALVPENGTLISLTRKRIIRTFSIGRAALDGNRIINMESSIIKDRMTMAAEGVVFVSVHLAKNKSVSDIIVSASGLLDGNFEMHIKKIRDGVKKMLTAPHNQKLAPTVRNNKVSELVRTICRSSFRKNPQVMVHWVSPNQTQASQEKKK